MQIPFKKFTILRPQQEEIVNVSLESDKKYIMLNCPTGCHGINTLIRMYNNTVKKVQNIRVGDCLFGDDGTPRRVMELFRGKDDLYKVIPKNEKSFIVNGRHILSLKKPHKSDSFSFYYILNIPVFQYLKQNPTFKLEHKLYRNQLTNPKQFLLFVDFVVEKIGIGDYYGFQLDGNNLYCMENYIVTHNSGKSLQNMMIGHYTANKSLYVCSSKMLQNQLHNDFSEAKILKGRGNYQCNLHKSLSADSCLEKCMSYKKKLECYKCGSVHCINCQYDGYEFINCNYYDTKFNVLKSPYAILNTHYYLNELNYSGSFKNYQTVIIDEADILEEILTNFISFSIHFNLLKKYNLQEPEYVTKLESWLEWAKQSKKKIDEIYKQYLWVLKIKDEERKEYEKDIKEFNQIQNLQTKIDMLVENLDAGWLFDHKDRFEFSPIWLTPKLAEKYLWQHGQRFVLSSATLHQKPIMAKLLGLDISNIDYFETDSPFPVENRRIIYKPVVALRKKSDNYEEDENKIIDEIVKTIDTYKGQKGIIHTVSYKFAQKITKAHKRCITHNCNDKDIKLSDFFNSKDLVFVSPSSEHGLDLRDDLARFSVWAKVPFPNLTDKRISARLYGSGRFGQEWYSSVTAKKFEQGIGRTTRNMKDFSTAYIFDSQFDRIISYLSKSVKEAIETKW